MPHAVAFLIVFLLYCRNDKDYIDWSVKIAIQLEQQNQVCSFFIFLTFKVLKKVFFFPF